jgi:hypothetical protein
VEKSELKKLIRLQCTICSRKAAEKLHLYAAEKSAVLHIFTAPCALLREGACGCVERVDECALVDAQDEATAAAAGAHQASIAAMQVQRGGDEGRKGERKR